MIQKRGITLVTVPCWWDGELYSLASSICFQRPDLFPTGLHPIHLNPPHSYFPSSDIPEVGELMAASFPVDIKFIQSVTENSWWVGEKYDGIRCCWHPNRSTVQRYTRNGREVDLLPSFYHSLPKIFMDSELWFGRGLFSNTYNLCKGSSDTIAWDILRMVSFDVPAPNNNNEPFEERYTLLVETIKKTNPFIVIANRVMCKNSGHLNKHISGIIDGEGEGVICRHKGSLYVHGRSNQLVKLKTSYGDTEALVVGHNDDSVLLKLPNGQVFVVPPSGVQITKPEIGAVVTFSYEVHSRREVPVNPEIYRIREDLSWEEVVVNSVKEKKFRNEYMKSESFTEKPRGYWTPSNMRHFMTMYAKNLNLDPLLSETWLNIPLHSHKGGKAILSKFEGHSAAVESLFPEIKFDGPPQLSWKEVRHRRHFFENYAKENKFDPLIPENWYSQSRDWVKSIKGVHTVLSYYDNSVSKALIDLFPEIGLDKSKFLNWPLHYSVNRRQFFEKFAKSNKFDPLDAENWYPLSKSSIESQNEGHAVLGYHEGSLSKALIDLFPDIRFDKSKFWIQFHHSANRKKFFKNYALLHHFDPLVKENWYLLTREKILSVKGSTKVLSYHDNSISKALMDLFPNISLDRNELQSTFEWPYPENRRKFFEDYGKREKFDVLVAENWYSHAKSIAKFTYSKDLEKILSYHEQSVPRALMDLFPKIGLDKNKFVTHPRLWTNAKNRRKFFEDYAKEYGFDPLKASEWYIQPSNNIMAFRGAQRVIFYHGNSISKALMDLFPEIGIERSKFRFPQKFWNKPENRRLFFEDYAKVNKFDPQIAENWYSHPSHKIAAEKGAHRVLSYHRNSVTKALLDLFPDIGLDRSKFIFHQTYWTKIENRKKVFENYARENDFNPLDPESWYLQPLNKITASKEVVNVLNYHRQNVATALIELFPDIGLDQSKFNFQQKYWHRMVNRRKFFESYAKDNHFDPLFPVNWYSLSIYEIMAVKGFQRVLYYHKNSLSKALLDLFPNIGLEESKFNFPKT